MRWLLLILGLGLALFLALMFQGPKGEEADSSAMSPEAGLEVEVEQPEDSPQAELQGAEREVQGPTESSRRGVEDGEQETQGEPEAAGGLAVFSRISGWPAGSEAVLATWVLVRSGENGPWETVQTQTAALTKEVHWKDLSPGGYALEARTKTTPLGATQFFSFPLNADNSPRRFDFEWQEGLSLVGQVVDERGDPIKGAQVRDENIVDGFAGAGGVKTDDNGQFELALGVATPSRVAFSAEGFLPDVHSEYLGAGTPGQVTMTLVRRRPVTGVLRFPDGSPAPGVTLHATTKGHRDKCLTDGQGRFGFFGLDSGEAVAYGVAPMKPTDDLVGGVWTVSTSDKATDLDWTMGATMAVRGFLEDAQGTPLPDRNLSLYSMDYLEVSQKATSGIDGSAEFRGLFPGTYHLILEGRKAPFASVVLVEGVYPGKPHWVLEERDR